MSPERFLRKTQPSPRLESDFQNPPVLCLVRCMFGLPDDGDTQILESCGIGWQGPDYSVKEFAAQAGVSPFAIYKWLAQAAHFPVPQLAEFAKFVGIKSGGKDVRLADYFANLSGLSVMPMKADADKVRKILAIIEEK